MIRFRGLHRTLEIVRKEFIQVLRDPRMRGVVFMAPIVQLVIFGYAVSTDVRHIPTFIVDHDSSSASRGLIDALTGPGHFRVVGRSARSSDMVGALDHGRAAVGIEIPADFAERLGNRLAVNVQLLVDGTNSNVATIAMGYAERIIVGYGLKDGAGAGSVGIDLRARAWFNAGLESRNYNVPAVIGIIIMLVCQLLTSLAVVREREIGTLEQLMVSPLRPAELMAGKTIPFAIIGMIDLVFVSTVALVWFGVPFRGSVPLLLGASLLYLVSGLSMGLLISTVSRTQQEAFLTSFLLFMPTVLLSGFMFPVSGMPAFFRWATMVNPVRHYLEIVRAIFLKGAGFDALWPQYLALLVIGGGIFALATTRFHKIAR